MLAGCATPASSAAPSPTPTPTPAFSLTFPSEANLVPSDSHGEWFVIGLAEAADSIEAPHVLIVLRNAAGADIARRTIAVPSDPLPAGSGWPFREAFRPAGVPATAVATLLGNPTAAVSSPIVRGSVLRTFLDAQGSTVALGRLDNLGQNDALVEAVRLLGRDSTGKAAAVVDARPAADSLGPDDALPFLVRLPRGSESLAWEVFPIARPGNAQPPAVEILGAQSHQDDQGNPFVTAVVRNTSPEPLWLTLTALVLEQDEWLAGDSVPLPLPLSPGERLSFALRIPGTSLGLPDADEVRWQLIPRTTPAEERPIPIPSEVIEYRPVGSTLFLRVRLTGGDGETIRNPAAYASITGEEGRLEAAGWSAGPPVLEPGDSAEVTLAIPLPRGFDLTLAQLDVHGAGLPGGDAP